MTNKLRIVAPFVAIPIGAAGGVVILWLTALAIALSVWYVPLQFLTPWWTMELTVNGLRKTWDVLPGLLVLLAFVVFVALWVRSRWSITVKWVGWVLIAIVVVLNLNIAPAENGLAIIDLVAPVVIAWSIIGANWLIVRNIAKWETRSVKSQATVI